MAVCKLQYYQSYFSYYTSVDSDNFGTTDGNANDGFFNPFDVSSYSGGVINGSYDPVSSDDISYDSSTGRVTFSNSGTYMVIFNPSLNLIASGGGGVGFVDAKITKNGSTAFDATGNNYYHNTSLVPKQHTFSSLIEVDSDDYLEFFVRTISSTKELNSNNGTSVVILRVVGDYGHITYTDADNGGNTSVIIGNNIATEDRTILTSSNVTHSSGGFTPPTGARNYLMFSSFSVLQESGGSEISVDIDMLEDTSEITDSTLSIQSNQDPFVISHAILRQFDGTKEGISRATASGGATFALGKATTFGFIDISTEEAKTGSVFSLSCNNDSSALGSGDQNCFDNSNWSTINTTQHVTASGISYTSSNGKIIISDAGVYLLVSHLIVDQTSSTRDINFYVKQEGSKIYVSSYSLNANWTPRDLTTAIVVNCAASDELEFGISDGNTSTFFKAGSSVSIFKINYGTHPSLDTTGRGLTLTEESTPQAQIADDFDLKTFDIDTLTPQRSRLTDQVPFVLGVPGPLSLRGRCFGQTKEPPIVKPGDKKN